MRIKADYKADVEQPLSMIYQSGYLTIKGYDCYTHSYLLDFPNNEVHRGFLSLIATGYFRTHLSVTRTVEDWTEADYIKPPASPYISHVGLVRFFLSSFPCSTGAVRCRLLFSAAPSKRNIPCK